MTGERIALQLTSVSAGYRDRDVVSEVSLRVRAGSWVSIIGPNGAGKSTLLKCAAGLLEHRGSVAVHGDPLESLSRRQRARRIGYAAQSPALPDGMTVTDYALLGRTPHLRPLARESAADLDLVADVLVRLDLTELADRPLRTLSGGERQRAVLARVLVQQSRVLLLDEPTTGLDVGHAQSLLELVDLLRREDGITVVSTLHDLTFAAQYADTLLLLDSGRAVATGTASEVLTEEALWQHYAARAEVLRTADGRVAIAPSRTP